MLSLMRKHAGSWMIKLILGAVILAFIPFGYGIYQDRRDTEIASVNGEPIFYENYNRIYNNLIDQMRQSFGDALNEDMIKSLRLRDQAMNQLIDEKLLLAEADRLDLDISDKELAEVIGQIEAFQTAGVFDSRRYEYILDRNRLSKDMFEAEQKKALKIGKIRNFIMSGAKVSNQEAEEWYRWNDASANIDYVRFSPDVYKDIKPTDEEINAFFDTHKENYKTEPKLKVRYLFFNPDNYKTGIDIAEEVLREYYDDNSAEFSTPKTVEARHVLIRVAEGADEKTVAKTKKEIEDILKLAREGSDFAELAKKHSQGPSAGNGGYLGSFRKESMVKPFSDAAFALNAGQISEPVRTQFGWHIIKVEKVNPASTTSFEDARSNIREKLISEKARTLAYDEAEQVYDASFEGDDLLRNAADRKLTVVDTDYFTRQGPEAGISDRTGFATAAFGLSLMEISEVLELQDGYYVMQVVEKLEPQIPELKDVLPKVRADLIKTKQHEKSALAAEAFLADVKKSGSLAEESARQGLRIESTGFFKRGAAVPNIGFDRAFSDGVFALSDANRLPDKVFKVNDMNYVISYAERKEPNAESFEKEKNNIKAQLLRQKQSQIINSWLAEKRNSSEIMIDEKFLQ
jgi:peptidyl-prolyl cis-trans isomerase D